MGCVLSAQPTRAISYVAAGASRDYVFAISKSEWTWLDEPSPFSRTLVETWVGCDTRILGTETLLVGLLRLRGRERVHCLARMRSLALI